MGGGGGGGVHWQTIAGTYLSAHKKVCTCYRLGSSFFEDILYKVSCLLQSGSGHPRGHVIKIL